MSECSFIIKSSFCLQYSTGDQLFGSHTLVPYPRKSMLSVGFRFQSHPQQEDVLTRDPDSQDLSATLPHPPSPSSTLPIYDHSGKRLWINLCPLQHVHGNQNLFPNHWNLSISPSLIWPQLMPSSSLEQSILNDLSGPLPLKHFSNCN